MNTLLKLSDNEHGVGVLKSTLPVVESARHVWIDQRAVNSLVTTWCEDGLPEDSGTKGYGWSDGTKKSLTATLLLHAWNFSFWAEPGKPKWTVEVDGETLDGFKALVACFKRAVADGVKLHDPRTLAKMSQKKLAKIFRGQGEIPMLEARLANAREVGKVLLERWDGDFCNLLQAAENSAVSLVELLAGEFSSFHDTTIYYGREVKFFKRAQVLVMDLAATLPEESLVQFHDLHQLSAFADYKIPQVLEGFGVLRYTPELKSLLEREQALPVGDPQEVEIRAGMVWAVEVLRRGLQDKGHEIPSYKLDKILWQQGQESSDNQRPYHRTRSIYY